MSRHAGASRGENDVDVLIVDPDVESCHEGVQIIGLDVATDHNMSSGLRPLLQDIPALVVRPSAGVRHGEDGDVQGPKGRVSSMPGMEPPERGSNR